MTNLTNKNSDLERKLIPVVTEIESVKQGRSLVVVIGINEYVHWQKLKNAVQDAVGIQQALIDKLGFTAPNFSPLLDSAATKMAIESLIEDQLYNFLEEDDSLILFFAGHGSTRVERGGKITGFLVPVEADKSWSSYIKIERFLQDIGTLRARHILVILDSCFSGIALGNAMIIHRDAIQYREDLGKRMSRKVITSARYEQTALDGGPIPGHSLFTGTLIDGINSDKADTDANGFITSFELGHFLQSQVGNGSNQKQTPDYGTFCDDMDERGEMVMVIPLGNQSFEQIKNRASSALDSGQLTTFKELVEQLILLKPSSPKALYLEYRLVVIEGNFEKANVIIDRLSQLNLVEGIIPFSENALWELKNNLPYWMPVLKINEIESSIDFTVLTGKNSASLEPVYEQAIGEVQGYSVSNNAIFQVCLKNITNFPVYVYAIQITPSGFLDSVILLKSQAMLNGLMPETIELTYPFIPGQEPGIGEIRLFTSSQKLEWFMFPPKPGAKDYLPPIDVNEIKNMKMRSIIYRVEATF